VRAWAPRLARNTSARNPHSKCCTCQACGRAACGQHAPHGKFQSVWISGRWAATTRMLRTRGRPPPRKVREREIERGRCQKTGATSKKRCGPCGFRIEARGGFCSLLPPRRGRTGCGNDGPTVAEAAMAAADYSLLPTTVSPCFLPRATLLSTCLNSRYPNCYLS